MTRHPCFICGQNMTVASQRRLLFLEDDNHQTVEVGRDCYARAVSAGAEGITQLRGIGTVRVFQRLDQAKAYRRLPCGRPSHHEHGPGGPAECPVCQGTP